MKETRNCRLAVLFICGEGRGEGKVYYVVVDSLVVLFFWGGGHSSTVAHGRCL